jgi:diguanylate cyclase (GGDEF)-like protein
VLVPQANDPDEAATVARKILAAVAKPAIILGHECRVTASVGIAQYPAEAEDEQSLLQNADFAMYLAKKAGRNNFQVYSKCERTQPG